MEDNKRKSKYKLHFYFKKARLRENVNDSFKNSKLVSDRDLDKNTSHMVHFNKGIV